MSLLSLIFKNGLIQGKMHKVDLIRKSLTYIAVEMPVGYPNDLLETEECKALNFRGDTWSEDITRKRYSMCVVFESSDMFPRKNV